MNLSGWEPRKRSASASAHLDVIRTAAAWAVMLYGSLIGVAVLGFA